MKRKGYIILKYGMPQKIDKREEIAQKPVLDGPLLTPSKDAQLIPKFQDARKLVKKTNAFYKQNDDFTIIGVV